MEVINEIIKFLTGFSFQLTVSALLFCVTLKRRKFFWYKFIPSILLFNILPEVIPGRYEAPFLVVGGWFSFVYPIMVLMLVGILCLCFQIKFSNALYYVVAAYAMQHILFNGSILLRRTIFQFITETIVWRLINLAIEILLWTIFYFLFVLRFQQSESSDSNPLSRILFSIVTILVVYVLNLWVRKTGLYNKATMIYPILCCIFLLVIQCNMFERTKLQKKNELTLQLLQLSQKQYELNKENIDIINVKCHDLKHQIRKIRKTTDLEEQRKYFAEAEKAVLIYDAFVKTGNEALDTVLTEKNLVCENKNIRFCNIIDGEAISFMEAHDIYALFGNALNNAIESVEKTEEDKRVICLNILKKGELVKIHMDNYCEDELVFEDGLPSTTKENVAYHGFGTKSIKMIVEKYKGNVVMSRVDNRFCLDILFTK